MVMLNMSFLLNKRKQFHLMSQRVRGHPVYQLLSVFLFVFARLHGPGLGVFCVENYELTRAKLQSVKFNKADN